MRPASAPPDGPSINEGSLTWAAGRGGEGWEGMMGDRPPETQQVCSPACGQEDIHMGTAQYTPHEAHQQTAKLAMSAGAAGGARRKNASDSSESSQTRQGGGEARQSEFLLTVGEIDAALGQVLPQLGHVPVALQQEDFVRFNSQRGTHHDAPRDAGCGIRRDAARSPSCCDTRTPHSNMVHWVPAPTPITAS